LPLVTPGFLNRVIPDLEFRHGFQIRFNLLFAQLQSLAGLFVEYFGKADGEAPAVPASPMLF
jgi:hypothetical protein